MQITITRAINELKLLKARIEKEIDQIAFVGLYQNKDNKILGLNQRVEDFEKAAKAEYESIEALIKRRRVVKSKIMESNAKTQVEIAGKKLMVIDAIEMKRTIDFEKKLLEKLKGQNNRVIKTYEEQRVKLEAEVLKMYSENLKGENKQIRDDDLKKLAQPLIDANGFNISDPLKAADLIEKYDEQIDKFLSEVDFVLSESNARTMIEVPD